MAAVGFTKIVLWSWPAGERLSHRGFDCEPVRDWGHPMERHRFIALVPEALANEIVCLVPHCELLVEAGS
jgi:hypothetical protein